GQGVGLRLDGTDPAVKPAQGEQASAVTQAGVENVVHARLLTETGPLSNRDQAAQPGLTAVRPSPTSVWGLALAVSCEVNLPKATAMLTPAAPLRYWILSGVLA